MNEGMKSKSWDELFYTLVIGYRCNQYLQILPSSLMHSHVPLTHLYRFICST